MEEEKKRRGRPRKNPEKPLPTESAGKEAVTPETPGREAAGAPALTEADWERRKWGLAMRLYLACRAYGMAPAILEAERFTDAYRKRTEGKEEPA